MSYRCTQLFLGFISSFRNKMRSYFSAVFQVLICSFWSCNCVKDVEVSCVYQEDCVLPCSFIPGKDPVIHWTKQSEKEPDDIPVHIYYYNKHQLQHQHENFTGRTSLSDTGILTGDATLELHKVRFSDEGRYKCYVNTVSSDDEVNIDINVKVSAPVLLVSLEQKEEQVVCRSENIYPRPKVTWTFSSEPLDPQTSTQSSETGLFSVSSSVPLLLGLSPPLEYCCNISTEYSWRSATYRRNPHIYFSDSVTVMCTKPKAPVKSLVWKFNHREIILNGTGSEVDYSDSWTPVIDELEENNDLVLKDLSQNRLGLFTCDLHTESEEFIITTEVGNVWLDNKHSGNSSEWIVLTVAMMLMMLMVVMIICVVISLFSLCRLRLKASRKHLYVQRNLEDPGSHLEKSEKQRSFKQRHDDVVESEDDVELRERFVDKKQGGQTLE